MPVDSYGLGAAMILITNVILAFAKPFLLDIPVLKANEGQFNTVMRLLNVVINLALICGYVGFTGQLNWSDLPSYGIQAALQAAGANTVFLFVKGNNSGKSINTNTSLASDIENAAQALGNVMAKQPLQPDPAAKTNVITATGEIETVKVPAAPSATAGTLPTNDAAWLG